MMLLPKVCRAKALHDQVAFRETRGRESHPIFFTTHSRANMTNSRGIIDRWWVLRKALLLCLVFPVGLVGCGGGNLAPVKGKVTVSGEPAKGGSLIFSPLGSGEEASPGKPASAEIQSDGTYTLGTNRPSDGAHVGHHRIGFTPPPQQLTDAQRTDPKYKAPPPLYMGMVPKPNETEVKPGSNTIDIELVFPGK